MKATLCVLVALVAVTSALPSFVHSNRRGTCAATGWCAAACKCDTGASADDCTGTNANWCTNPGGSGAVTPACSNTDGTVKATAACKCGSATVTTPAAKKVDTAANGYCLLETASSAANIGASTGTCAVKSSGTNAGCATAWAVAGDISQASCNGADIGTCAVASGGTNSGCASKTTFDTCNNEDIGTCAVRAGGTNSACAGKTTKITCLGSGTGQGNKDVTDAANTCVFTATAANDCVFTPAAANACEFTATAANDCEYTAATDTFCFETSTENGYNQASKQCSTYASGAQADGSTAAAQACMCGTASVTPHTCSFCYDKANYVGVNGAVIACDTTDGTAAFAKSPNKCKCGNGVAGFGEYCLASNHGPIAACSNNDGTVVNGATPCACITTATGVATVTQATSGLCTAGTASTVQACAITDGSAANTPPCTCGSATCTTGQKCTSATSTCVAAAPTAAPTYGAVTIVQKLTMSGTQSDYAGNVKSLAEEAYGKALGIFDTAASPPAYKTGCSVTSVASASRRAYAVTFTATTSASTGAAANT